MPVVIVVGVQWGDEGKGKIVDYLTEPANLVVRFQGGNNAGHTVIVEGQKTALKLIPSGILRPSARCLLAAGVVLDPHALLEEMKSLEEIDINVTPDRFGIAGEVTLILPYHKAIDGERENLREGGSIGTIGTTRKGIGPAYEDSVSRDAIRMADLFDEKHLRVLVERNVAKKNKYIKSVLDCDVQFSAEEIFEDLQGVAKTFKPYVTNVSSEVAKAIDAKEFVVFEGAQGALLDISHGTYPFVTSSNTVAAYACVSGGFGPKQVDRVLGICKAYATRVGGGPFPTEDTGTDGDTLRNVGKEFGTVTGRPRRCGWFDVKAVQRAVRLNGIDSLIITKLDVLTGFSKLKLGTSYVLDGKTIEDLPVSHLDIERVEAQYEEIDGWQEDITGVRTLEELPSAARKFLDRIAEVVGCEIGGFSVGPDREQTILLDEGIRSFAVV
jgi:adenylosuccinate synthase